jgi:adenosylcobinamide kinase/adenosylcobinamide-phosphate guanylyltransferase
MRLRVARHRRSRPERWRTVEEPLRVARVLAREQSGVVIVDCLTLLISDLLLERSPEGPETAQELAEREEAVMREIEVYFLPAGLAQKLK